MAKPQSLLQYLAAGIEGIRPDDTKAGDIEVMNTEEITEDLPSDVRFILKTGLVPFDAVVGGFPFCKIVEIFGMDTSGKTSLVMRAVKAAHKREIYEVIRDGGTVVERKIEDDAEVVILYVDNEQSLSSDRVEIDGEHVPALIARCDTVEQLFKIIDTTLKRVKVKRDAEIEECEKKGKKCREYFVLVVVDTIASTSSKEEMTQAWDKDDFPRMPKQIRQGFRTLTRDIARMNVCVICTNQVSDSMGAKKIGYNVPVDKLVSPPGGRALKFYATSRIFMHQLDNTMKLTQDARFPAGYLIGVKTIKNRLKKPLRECRMALMFDGGDSGHGGWSNDLIILETLLFLKLATYEKETDGKGGTITFRFSSVGIQTTTFGDVPQASLEEADMATRGRSRKKKNPSISEKYEWPAYYAAHKADFDLLWAKAEEILFVTEGAGQNPLDDGTVEVVDE